MSRSVTLGNGSMLVGLDERGQVRDFYYPYVGHANHVSGASGSYAHRVGVWVDGKSSWLSESSWDIEAKWGRATATSNIFAKNAELGVSLLFLDAVHNEKNVFLRHVIVKNLRDINRTIKIFFGQEFRISESRRGDTAFYDPRVNSVIHYKGNVAFLINAYINKLQFSEYSVGLFDIEGKAGTYADAEDGLLSRNPIEHGSVDSVIGLTFEARGREGADIFYWIAVGSSVAEAHKVNKYVFDEHPERLLISTSEYWHAWMEKEKKDLSLFSDDIQELYRRSLAIIRVHTDNHGGIIASSDSDMLNQGRDTYSYVWPRDAAISANALDRAGYEYITQKFFSFITKQIEADGYLMHKYTVDGLLGSSWHPWIRNGRAELPIQEDETALVVCMLWEHYKHSKDLELMESFYNPFIEPAANFMCGHIEESTGLPAHSYDLWEEKYGTSTYTAATVYGALIAASEFATLLGKRDAAQKFRSRAQRIQEGILGYLYDADSGSFVKLIEHGGESLRYDHTIDISSFHGVVHFGVLSADDTKLARFHDVIKEHLWVPTDVGGYIRYEGDQYYKTSPSAPSNPWCVATLWMAQYYVKLAKTKKELKKALELIEWVVTCASKSGILAEQMHPYTKRHLSTAPLVWSHAEFAITVDEYLKKHNSL